MDIGWSRWIAVVGEVRDALANRGLSEHEPDVEIGETSELLRPLAPLLPTAGPLVIVPHGPLHNLPWAALRLPNGEPYPALSTAPSLSTLVRVTEGRPPAAASPLVAFRASDQVAVGHGALADIRRRIDPRGHRIGSWPNVLSTN